MTEPHTVEAYCDGCDDLTTVRTDTPIYLCPMCI